MNPRILLLTATLVLTTLAGCLADDGTDGTNGRTGDSALAGASLWDDPQNGPHADFGWPTLSSPAEEAPYWWQSIEARELPDPIAALEHVANTEGIQSGGGLALFGRLAVVPGYGPATAVVDISDPTAPQVLSTFEPQQSTHRGAAIIAYPDGRLVTVISTSTIIDVWDITDPTEPYPLPPLEPTQGSHKVGVVPGTPIVYNAASAGGNGGLAPGAGSVDPAQATGVTEIFDLSDPENAVHVQDFANGYSCHHVYFWNDASQDKHRAICAGIEYTQIWDTADPRNPEVIVNVPYGHGLAGTPSGSASIAAFSHYAGLNQDGTILLVGDESGGGLGPIGCAARIDTPLGALSVPNGAVWFYDVSDEQNPTLAGWISASQIERITGGTVDSSCTAHHGRLVPSEDRDLIAMSFYGAGVLLLDFTDPALPFVVDQWADQSNTWETWYYNGYLFTGDLARGMDVLTFA